MANVNPQTQSVLFKLPAEIRNMIVSMACESTTLNYNAPRNPQGPIDGRKWRPDIPPPPPKSGNPTAPAIVLTCKRMHEESIQVLYANATFSFNYPSDLRIWAEVIPFDLRKLVRRVELVHNRSINQRLRDVWSKFVREETGLRVEVPLVKGSWRRARTGWGASRGGYAMGPPPRRRALESDDE